MGKSAVEVTLPAVAFATMLRFAAIPVSGKQDRWAPESLSSIHIEVGESTFAGFDSDFRASWEGAGVTVASTDRYRLHFGGHVSEGPMLAGSLLVAIADVKQALMSAPRKAGMVTLAWDGVSGEATLAWPRSTFKVGVLTAGEFPRWRDLVDKYVNEPAAPTGAFNGRYMADAMRGLSVTGRVARVRMNGLKPALVAQSPDLDSPVALGAMVMPVREVS